jgi:deoxyribodipyrimidine photo-lyase
MENKLALFWHRRDLRINDNHGLIKALTSGQKIIPIFIFDTTILSKLKSEDQRVIFIHQQIEKIKAEYQSFGSDLLVYYGNPIELIPQIAKEFSVQKVFTNRDYEPQAIQRDTEIFEILNALSIEFIGSKDHVIFEKNEVVKDDGKPYTVFTPYSRKWKTTLTSQHLASFDTRNHVSNLQPFDHKTPLITLNEMGFDGIETV